MTATIWIVSGEGETGHRERYDGAMTVRALKARLSRERCGGDRWSRCEVETDERHPETASPEDAIEAMRLPCTVPACPRPAIAHGLCSSHYQQRKRGRELTPLRTPLSGLVRLGSIRVAPPCREALGEHPSERARIVLEEWARAYRASKEEE